jgi:undecaprenyl-diphosphatase
MLEKILELDTQIFLWFNKGCSNAVFDAVMPFLRQAKNWIPLYFIFGVFTFVRYKKRGFLVFLFCCLSVALADRISSGILKPEIGRLRPCHNQALKEKMVLRLTSCGGQFGFVSSHAANHFALALFFAVQFKTKRFPYLKVLLFGWAASISLAQIYVGVHYPLDILFGAILGLLCAQISLFLYHKLESKLYTL